NASRRIASSALIENAPMFAHSSCFVRKERIAVDSLLIFGGNECVNANQLIAPNGLNRECFYVLAFVLLCSQNANRAHEARSDSSSKFSVNARMRETFSNVRRLAIGRQILRPHVRRRRLFLDRRPRQPGHALI